MTHHPTLAAFRTARRPPTPAAAPLRYFPPGSLRSQGGLTNRASCVRRSFGVAEQLLSRAKPGQLLSRARLGLVLVSVWCLSGVAEQLPSRAKPGQDHS